MKNFERSLLLISMFFKASIRRVRYDFAREIVVAFCTIILVLLFFYIFYDFINIKVAELSATLKEQIAKGFAFFILGLAAVWCGRVLRNHRTNPVELARVCQRKGEIPEVLLIYTTIKTLIVSLFIFGAAWLIILEFFVKDQSLPLISSQGMALLIVLLFWIWPVSKEKNRNFDQSRSYLARPSQSKNGTLTRWRVGQILLRNRTTRICLAFALFIQGLVGLTSYLDLPLFLIGLLVMVSSILVMTAMAFQLESDMKYAWLDKSLGVSHQEMVNTYFRIAMILGSANGLISYLVSGFAHPLLFSSGNWKLLALGLLSPVLLPSLMFQIDPRRPAISIITCFIATLFLGTAIFAHSLALLLIPVVIYYANQYQNNSFYQYY